MTSLGGRAGAVVSKNLEWYLRRWRIHAWLTDFANRNLMSSLDLNKCRSISSSRHLEWVKHGEPRRVFCHVIWNYQPCVLSIVPYCLTRGQSLMVDTSCMILILHLSGLTTYIECSDDFKSTTYSISHVYFDHVLAMMRILTLSHLHRDCWTMLFRLRRQASRPLWYWTLRFFSYSPPL